MSSHSLTCTFLSNLQGPRNSHLTDREKQLADVLDFLMASHGIPRVAVAEPPSEESRQRELRKIDEYQQLVQVVEQKIRDHDYTADTLHLTSQLLRKNPEYYTIWNHRRRVLSSQLSKLGDNHAATAEVLASDLRFLVPLLLEFPKCYWIWNYRLWLLQQADVHLPAASARSFWEEELGLVMKMLSRDGRNFHGWGYRRIVVAALESDRLAVDGKGGSMAAEELEYTTKMIHANLSNFSAWHNRSKLIPLVLEQTNATDEQRRKMLDEELDLIHEALIDPYDQSLWFYHACLMSAFTPSQTAKSIAPSLSKSQRAEYLEGEIAYILDMLDGAEDCKWIYQNLVQISQLVRDQTGDWPKTVERSDVENWMRELKRVDPIRLARWEDLERQLAI